MIGGPEMRMLLVLVVGALVASGLAVLAPGASASVPVVSKTCRSLNALNTKLDAALNLGKVDSGAIGNLSKSFRSAAKTGSKSLKSAMNTIADVAADVSHTGSTAAAAAALKKAGQKITVALVTWQTYLTKNCSGASPSTT